MEELTMKDLVNFCKQYGFIFQGSEIYGGLANTWDFGPVGVELKKNLKNAWMKKFIQEDINNVGLDSAILMNPKTWEASGHLSTFSDPLIDCKECKTRYRADNLINDYTNSNLGDTLTNEERVSYIKENKVPCPKCGKSNFTEIREFNLMFKTFQGVTEDSKSAVYLRPETAQGIFVNFMNVQRSMRLKVPFGIGQVGKSFRNEITPGNFIFRVREFEQMELEFFCKPGTELDWFKYYKDKCKNFLLSLNNKYPNTINPNISENAPNIISPTKFFIIFKSLSLEITSPVVRFLKYKYGSKRRCLNVTKVISKSNVLSILVSNISLNKLLTSLKKYNIKIYKQIGRASCRERV